jgi:hypothetical protein
MAKRNKLDAFTRAYLIAALWSSTDDDGDPLDSLYDLRDFSDEAIKKAIEDTTAFQEENEEDLSDAPGDDEQHGHDFWLTRNRHGAGFWDRGYGAVGDRLTDAAEAWGEVWLYVGDDGELHFM